MLRVGKNGGAAAGEGNSSNVFSALEMQSHICKSSILFPTRNAHDLFCVYLKLPFRYLFSLVLPILPSDDMRQEILRERERFSLSRISFSWKLFRRSNFSSSFR